MIEHKPSKYLLAKHSTLVEMVDGLEAENKKYKDMFNTACELIDSLWDESNSDIHDMEAYNKVVVFANAEYNKDEAKI